MENEQCEVYLDNAATTKPRPEVAEVMVRMLSGVYANASSLHAPGKAAKTVLEQSRETVANALGVDTDEIYFTSGGTEANNLVTRGVCRARGKEAGQIITSTLEHPSVTRSIRSLKREGWPVTYIDAIDGQFDMAALKQAIKQKTSLVSIMTVQNELGYIMPIPKIAALRDEYAPNAVLHTDAVQALGKVPLQLRDWGVDAASFSAHKIGGPKGIGALYVKRGTHLFTTALGGGQERGLRSGTEAVFLIAGFAEALKQTFQHLEQDATRTRDLWNYLVERIRACVPSVVINSLEDGSPYICNMTFPKVNNQKLLDYLSGEGIYVSKAAACETNHDSVPAGTWRPKHPLSLQAAGIPLSLGRNTLRISFGYDSTREDVDRFVAAVAAYVAKLR